MQPEAHDLDLSQKEGHFTNYGDYSRTLRAWLVAYGVGAPILFLTTEGIAAKVAESGYGHCVVLAFLGGVALQILLSFINKWAAWHMYVGAGDGAYQRGIRYKFWGFINKQSWIDLAMDIAAIGLMVWATWRVLDIFLGPPSVA